jgi:ATP-dependent DNA ligase
VKTAGKVMLYSRRGKSFNSQFRDIANALNYLPDETVVDGEVVAIDENGRPNFNLLQNFRSAGTNIQYFAFDILMHKGKELTRLPLSEWRQVLASVIKPDTYVEISEASDRPLSEMVKFVREHVLEGIVDKRGDSVYQPGLRTGLGASNASTAGRNSSSEGLCQVTWVLIRSLLGSTEARISTMQPVCVPDLSLQRA